MSKFNDLFKKIVLEYNLNTSGYFPDKFPDKFNFVDEGIEFINDIMPTYGPQYQWKTAEDLANIPQLVNALQNTEINLRLKIADEFAEIANYKQDELRGTIDEHEYDDIINNYRHVCDWIYNLQDNPQQLSTETEDAELNSHDPECFGTTPDVVKEVRPRHYRRGLKALSLANRKKFNQSRYLANMQIEEPKSKTDRLNKIEDKVVSQQPITKSTILPEPGVNRPVGLNRNQKHVHNFSNTVYMPSITRITKENAKKRCLAARKNK